MPELPEVETTRRGLEPHLVGRRIAAVMVRNPRLRWPVPEDLPQRLTGLLIQSLGSRAKYLLIRLAPDPADPNRADRPDRPARHHEGSRPTADRQPLTLIVHLGMSGSLAVIAANRAPRKHDHIELVLDDGMAVRYHDPRRFGSLHLATHPERHRLLERLGPEPNSDAGFTADYLYQVSRTRRISIRQLLMNASIVVGIGNIYANESLFAAGVSPRRKSGRLTRRQCAAIVSSIEATLSRAIERGGTTLRDFVGGDGRPGYFQQELEVYGRDGEPCRRCGAIIVVDRRSGRAEYRCPGCQR